MVIRLIKVCDGLFIQAKKNDLRTNSEIIKEWKRNKSNSKLLHQQKLKKLAIISK